MANAFIEFVKEYRKNNPSLSYKDAMIKASKVYKKDTTKKDTTKKSSTKKELKGGISMVITDISLSKKDRAKKVKQFKKVKAEIDANLKNMSLIPKQYTLFQTIGKELAGNSKKNIYARSLQQVVRKLGTKKFSILKEKLEKASPESTVLLLAEQKASNIKRPTKTQQKFNEEQNRENRLRKKIANKIEAFKKNPDNKGKNIPRSKFTREADKEVDEELSKSIETTVKSIEGKKKGASGVSVSSVKSKKKPKTLIIKKTTTTIAPPSRASSPVPKAKKLRVLTQRMVERIKEYETLMNKIDNGGSNYELAEFLYQELGMPNRTAVKKKYAENEKLMKLSKEATGVDNTTLSTLDEVFGELLDEFDDIKDTFKAKPKAPAPKASAPKARPKLPSPKVPPKTKPTGLPLNRKVGIYTVPASIYSSIEGIFKPLIREGNYGVGKSNLVAQNKRQRPEPSIISAISASSKLKDKDPLTVYDAVIDDFEKRQFGEIVSNKTGSSSRASSSASSASASVPTGVKLPPYVGVVGEDGVFGKINGQTLDKGIDLTKYPNMEKIKNQIEDIKGDGVVPKQPKESWLAGDDVVDMLKTNPAEAVDNLTKLDGLFGRLITDGGDNKIEMDGYELEKNDPNLGGIEGILFSYIQAYNYVVAVIKLNQPSTVAGEGFANEDINNLDEVKTMTGGALVEYIQKKLVDKNKRIVKDTKIKPEHNGMAKMSASAYVKPDKRQNIDGFVYLANQSDEENAVYIDKQKEQIIIAFRGSAKLKDLKTDLSLALGRLPKTGRYATTNSLVEKLKTLYPSYDIKLTGHSLGGSLAVEMATKHNIPSVVFNAGHTVGNNDARTKDITYYTREGDPVSMLGSNSYKNVRLITGDKKGHRASHSLQNFISEDDVNKVGGSFLGDAGKAILFGNKDGAEDRLRGVASGVINTAVDGVAKGIGNVVKRNADNMLYGGMLGEDPATYTPLKNMGGSLVDKIKHGLTSYAKTNSKVRKALLLKDVYNLAKEIKNDGFKKNMLGEVSKIAMELI